MIDTEIKILDTNRQIEKYKLKANKALRAMPLAILISIFFISRVWPLDKRPVLSLSMIISMAVFMSTFIYAYYSNILKVKKLKKELEF